MFSIKRVYWLQSIKALLLHFKTHQLKHIMKAEGYVNTNKPTTHAYTHTALPSHTHTWNIRLLKMTFRLFYYKTEWMIHLSPCTNPTSDISVSTLFRFLLVSSYLPWLQTRPPANDFSVNCFKTIITTVWSSSSSSSMSSSCLQSSL